MIIRLLFISLCFAAWSAHAEPSEADYHAMNVALQSPDGLVAEVHGIDPVHHIYVLAWRDKIDFFKYAYLPLIPRNPQAAAVIATIHRLDTVRVKGSFDEFLDPSHRHIDVNSIELVKPFDPGYHNIPPFEHKVKLPDDLIGKNEIIVKVHSVLNDGQLMMVEYLDTNIPVIVTEPDRVKDLWHGDKIKIKFTISPYPKDPLHLQLDKGADAVTMVRSVREVTSKDPKAVWCGRLALYVDSPIIDFDVYAMEVDIGDGYTWTYTLLDPNDNDVFAALRKKMNDFWHSHEDGIVRRRNYLVNPNIKVCASGAGNEIDPNQANPQIYIKSADDLTVQPMQ